MSGVFQIDRKIFENSIWNHVTEFRIFFYIVGNAVWKEEGTDVEDIHVKRGQYLRSYRNLREDLVYMEKNATKYYGMATIKRTIDKLVKDGRLEKEETRLGTLFTVINYGEYQGFDRFGNNSLEQEQQRNSNGTATEQGGWNSSGTPLNEDADEDVRLYDSDNRNSNGTPLIEEVRNKKKNKNNNNKKDIYVLPEDEEQFLETLSKIENYPVDRKKDLEMYHSLQERYPTLDVHEAIEQWRMYKLDKPLQKNSNPRSQINTAFRKYMEWGKCLKKEPESKRADIFRFEGSERRI